MTSVVQVLKKYAEKLVISGLVVGAGGNISLRDGDYMYISPSGFDLQEINDANWVKVNINTGEILSELKPSSEILMHLECFRQNKNINAVLHAHPSYTVAVSSSGKNIPAMFPDFPAMIKKISYIDYIIPTTHVLADAVAEVVIDSQAIVMRNHGVLTVGGSMKEAFFYMQLIEEAAKIYVISSTIGTPRIFSEEECKDIRNLSSETYRVDLLKKGKM